MSFTLFTLYKNPLLAGLCVEGSYASNEILTYRFS